MIHLRKRNEKKSIHSDLFWHKFSSYDGSWCKVSSYLGNIFLGFKARASSAGYVLGKDTESWVLTVSQTIDQVFLCSYGLWKINHAFAFHFPLQEARRTILSIARVFMYRLSAGILWCWVPSKSWVVYLTEQKLWILNRFTGVWGCETELGTGLIQGR